MELKIEPGIVHTIKKTVEQKDTASSYGSGLIEVFATPAMIALMENTAHSSLKEYLPEGYITLGIEINVKHMKATPVGMKVRCESKLVKVEGKKLFFELNAWDEKGQIGSGTHIRYIVHGEEFMKKIAE
jgi:fluoroacetyl-CoA thioesterase